jgi:hypothetical protein
MKSIDAVYSIGGMLTINRDVSTDAGVCYAFPASCFSGDFGRVDTDRDRRNAWVADGDGMAGLWEEANGLDSEKTDNRSGNQDKVPWSYQEKFIAGTGSNDDQSFLHISNFEVLANGSRVLEWGLVTKGRVYRMLQTDTMINKLPDT